MIRYLTAALLASTIVQARIIPSELICEISMHLQSSPQDAGTFANFTVQDSDPAFNYHKSSGLDVLRQDARGILRIDLTDLKIQEPSLSPYTRSSFSQVITLIPDTSPGTPIDIEVSSVYDLLSSSAKEAGSPYPDLDRLLITIGHAREDLQEEDFIGYRKINTANVSKNYFGLATLDTKITQDSKPALRLETFDDHKKRYEINLTCDFP